MCIEVKLSSHFGNYMFQYVFARLLAVKNNLYLKTKFPKQDILKVKKHEKGKTINSPIIEILDLLENSDLKYLECVEEARKYYFSKKLKPAHYVLRGHFQDPNFFNPNEKLIKSFFTLDKIKKNTKDIVLNLRLGDYATHHGGTIIHPNWYLKILKNETFDKVHIVGSRPDEPYLKFFKKYNPIIVLTNSVDDFHFLRKFDKIICSNSTYAWWAAFLSEASTIYTFKKWTANENNGFKRRHSMKSFLKNAIRIDGDYYKGYKPKTYYWGKNNFKINYLK